MRSISCPIPPDRLRALYLERRLTDAKIAEILVSEGHAATAKRVRIWRRRYGIQTLPRWARNEVSPIEGKLKSLLVGSMLGDGRIVRRVHASHFMEYHCATQREYLEWKVVLWGSWVQAPLRHVITDMGDKRYEGFSFRTVAHPSLNPWRDMFYPNRRMGWKRLIPAVVDEVDAFALAVWYLDDGYAGWWPGITFGADEASRKVAFTIFEKFGLKPRWQARKGSTGFFHMEREETAERFLDIIRPHVPACMEYKVKGFGFQGPHYQVRSRLDKGTLQRLASRGVPIKQIARELGVGATTVSRRLEQWNIPHPRKKGRPVLEK